HGRPARRGVVYGPAHVAVGLWARWQGRALVPVQLVEAGASAVLVGAGLLASATPGTAALVYGCGYAVVRFALELVRGDPARPHARGLGGGEWGWLAGAAICALARPAVATIGVAGVLAIAAAALIATRPRRVLVAPAHLHELDVQCAAIAADPAHVRRDTAL